MHHSGLTGVVSGVRRMAVAKLKSPKNPDTQARILDAAIACVKKWGIEKVTLNDIAQEAGLTRPTVYSYYASRDEVVRYALLQSAYAFAEDAVRYVGKFENPRERMVEITLFALKRLPKEPVLALIQESGLASIMNTYALNSPEGNEIVRALFRVIIKDMQVSDETLDEMSEVAMRFMISLLTLEGPRKRNDKEMRAFLERRMLPALGM
jgi:AcrR family transcriptional regulator